jgi:hypothetical protein
VALLTAVSAMANPGDINNPPTQDWFFDSGGDVTIADKTWDINYNITVANDTHLILDSCTFTFSDPSDLYDRWISVWWNGSIDIIDCTFSSEGMKRYWIASMNDTVIMDSTFSGLTSYGGYGGITIMDGTVSISGDTTISDVIDQGLFIRNCEANIDGLTIDAGEDAWRGMMVEYYYTSWDQMFNLTMDNVVIKNVDGNGLQIGGTNSWAFVNVDIQNSMFVDNGETGMDLNPGYSSWTHNSSWNIDIINTEFSRNMWGAYILLWSQVYDGTGVHDVYLEGCTFKDNTDGGLYLESYDSDATVTARVYQCTFINNSQIGEDWGFGGMLIWMDEVYGKVRYEIDSCVFRDNDNNGLQIWNDGVDMDGSTLWINNTIFEDNEGYGVYDEVSFDNSMFMEFGFYNCTFRDNTDGGIFHQFWYLIEDFGMLVWDSTFEGGDSGITSDGNWEDASGVLWEILNTTFDDIDGPAIQFILTYQMDGGATLKVHDSTFNNTGGITFIVLDSWGSADPTHTLSLINTMIYNTDGPGVDMHVVGFYGLNVMAWLENVVVDTAMINGIKISTTTTFASASRNINMDLNFMDVHVSNIVGNGINLGTERVDYRGTRRMTADVLDISDTHKAMVISGLKGTFWNTALTTSRNQDIVIITSDVEFYEVTLDALNEDTVQVIESGSVKFWYKLKLDVMWETGGHVIGAVVEIMDNHHTLIGVYTQMDASGLPELMLNPFSFRETGLFSRSPYIIDVTFKNIEDTEPVILDSSKDVTIEIADRAPPSIFINDPSPGHIQQSKTIKVRGSAFDGESGVSKVEVSIDGTNWIMTSSTTSWQYTFTVTQSDVENAGGEFVIRAKAFDEADNSATAFILVSVDPFPPEIMVDFPTPDYQTNEETITVRGVTEMGATVLVNGEEVLVAGTLFQTLVDLVEGPNTITVSASDALGNVVTTKMEVVLDTKAPYVVVLTPEEGEMATDPTIDVSGQAEDGLTIMVGDNVLTPAQYNNGTFSYALALKRGDNMVTVTATDMAGNMLVIERMVNLDDVVPVLAVSSPTDGSFQMDTGIMVMGTTDTDATLLINDEVVILDHGLFSHELVGVEGENLITIVAVDAAGNSANVELTVSVDTVSPTLDFTTPAEDHVMVTDGEYSISGMASGASELWINGVMQTLTEGAFSVPVVLLEGSNRYTINAVDQAGNSVSVDRTISLDTVSPILVVRIPGIQGEEGSYVFKTMKGDPSVMRVTGYTDDAVQVLIDGEAVPISEEGYFEYEYSLTVNAANSVVVTAIDMAGNERSETWNMDHKIASPPEEDGFEIGWVILFLGLIILIIAIAVGFRMVSSRQETVQMDEVEEEEVLAPAELPDVEEEVEEDLEEELEEDLEEELEEDLDEDLEEDLEDEEVEIEVEVDDEEEVHELTPPSERPKTEVSRTPAAPAEAPMPEEDDKDLEDRDADADIGADETDQEGI